VPRQGRHPATGYQVSRYAHLYVERRASDKTVGIALTNAQSNRLRPHMSAPTTQAPDSQPDPIAVNAKTYGSRLHVVASSMLDTNAQDG